MEQTNDRPGNEVWFHDLVLSLEAEGLLDEFCIHVGLPAEEGTLWVGASAWPALKTHFMDREGNLDVARASRALLTVPAMNSSMRRLLSRCHR